MSGICRYDKVTVDAWKGCPFAHSGNYERGHEKAVREFAGKWCNHLPKALATPRAEEEMTSEKNSIEGINSTGVVDSRQYILVCAVCQYGDGVQPTYEEDNLP